MAVMLAILDERVKWRNVILLLPENPSEDRCVCCFRAQIGRERTSTQSNWTLQESIQAGHQQKCTDGRPYWKCHKLDFLYRRHSLIRMLEWVSVKGKCWPSYKRALYYNEKRKKKWLLFLYLCVLMWLFLVSHSTTLLETWKMLSCWKQKLVIPSCVLGMQSSWILDL